MRIAEKQKREVEDFCVCVWIHLDYTVPRVSTFADQDDPLAQPEYLHVHGDFSVNIDRDVPRADRQLSYEYPLSTSHAVSCNVTSAERPPVITMDNQSKSLRSSSSYFLPHLRTRATC
jgi:hypothetical protein